jgi:hypothetical protein
MAGSLLIDTGSLQMRDDPAPSVRPAVAPREMLWLLGQPHLSTYLEFVETHVVGGAGLCRRALADEWRAANDVYYELEQTEAGVADRIKRRPVTARLRPLVEELMASAPFRRTFDTLPMSVEMVELDKLIVAQPYVASSFSERRAESLGPSPSPEALFRYCQPLEAPAPEVRIEAAAEDHYVLSSESTDLREHRPQLLTGTRLDGLESTGPIAAAVALLVGFGSNFFTAISSDRRLVLHNGYHRAHSLRAAGIRHAPCLIQTVTRKDELRLAANEAVSSDPEFYFRSRRPPILRDFFDPRLTRRFAVRPSRTVVEVEFTVRRTCRVEAPSD